MELAVGGAEGGSVSGEAVNGSNGKRKARISTPDHEGDEGDGPEAKRRRNRFKSSCHACQRAKAKCTKLEDWDKCTRCTKRDEECVFDPITLPGKLDSQVIRKIEAFEKRLETLEARFNASIGPPSPAAGPSALQHNEKADSEDDAFTATFTALKQQVLRETGRTIQESPSWHSRNLPPYDELENAIDSNERNRSGSNEEDTESAAQALEDIALGGRRQYAPLGLNSETPAERNGGVPVPPPGSFTSIFTSLRGTPIDHPLLRDVPPLHVAHPLVDMFFKDVSFVYRILHTPTFMDEFSQLYAHFHTCGPEAIDPAWLATFFMVLATAASNAPRSHPSLLHFGTAGSTIASTWFDCAHSALEASGWASRPQARAIQAILLKMAFTRPGAPDAGATFFVWTAVALRLCQLMNLHKLGDDENTMPPEDPAWPQRPCSLRRELAKRIFWWSVAQDWMFSTSSQMHYLELGSFNTSLPAEVDEADLGLSVSLPKHPDHYLSDYSYTRVHFVVAHYQIVAAKLNSGHRGPTSYDTVLRLHQGLQTEIARIQATDQSKSNSNLRPYHKSLLLTILHNRILRLHRPFYMTAMSPKLSSKRQAQYARSVSATLESAAAICKGLKEIGVAGHTAILWFVPAYGISAVLALFISILGKLERREETSNDVQHLMDARSFYQQGLAMEETYRGPAAIQASKKACRIIDYLLRAVKTGRSIREARGTSGANGVAVGDPLKAAAGLFRQVSAVMAGASFSGGPGGHAPGTAASFLEALESAAQTPVDEAVPEPASIAFDASTTLLRAPLQPQQQSELGIPQQMATTSILPQTAALPASAASAVPYAGQSAWLDSLSMSFPTLNLFRQNGLLSADNQYGTELGYGQTPLSQQHDSTTSNQQHPQQQQQWTSFDSEASRHALQSLSGLDGLEIPTDNPGSLFGLGEMDWDAFLNVHGSP